VGYNQANIAKPERHRNERVWGMVQKLCTVLLVGFASMVAAPGSAAANPPANCNPQTDPSAIYSPCWQSYNQGKEWQAHGLVAEARRLGVSIDKIPADDADAICRQALQELNPADKNAFVQGCADITASSKPSR
jgi:hypothetical protein